MDLKYVIMLTIITICNCQYLNTYNLRQNRYKYRYNVSNHYIFEDLLKIEDMEQNSKISTVFNRLISHIKKMKYKKLDIVLYNRILSIDSTQFTKSDISIISSILEGHIGFSISYQKNKTSKIYLYPNDPQYLYNYIISNLNDYQTLRHKTTLHLI